MTAHGKDHAPRDEAQAEAVRETDLDELLGVFSQPNLTIMQAEELLARVHEERPHLVERLLAWLEQAAATDHTPAGLHHAGSPEIGAGAVQSGSDGTLHDVALVLLSYLGDRAIVPRLRAIVRNPRAPDEFKLKLISVIHDLEPQQDSQSLLDYLRYPGKAMLQSHRKHLQRLASPLERSFWLESMAEDMPVDARVSFARSSAEVDDPVAVPILICMCYDPDASVALAAMDAVERYKDGRALPALHELARHHPHEQVREEAQKVADRLGVRVPLSPQVEQAPIEPLYASYLTTIDGSGEQAAVFVRHVPYLSLAALELPVGAVPGETALLRLVQVSFNDEIGIEQCFGLDVQRDDLEDVLEELGAQGLAPVRVTYDQALAQLAEACAWTWQAGELLPLSFVAWREWICGPAWDQPAGEPQGDKLPPGRAISNRLRGRLYRACHELLYQDEFEDWYFESAEVDAMAAEYLRLIEAHGEPLGDDVLRALLCDGVKQIIHPTLRRQLQARLYRVAPLLRELYEDEDVWRWAVVAADALQTESPDPLCEHPLLLGMVGESLQLALDRDIDWTAAL